MSRDISFRAWDITVSYMLEWEYIVHDDYFLPALFGDFLIPMQYTGLKDKNGVEIYEGDILGHTGDIRGENEKNYHTHEVFWHDNDSADQHVGFQINRLHFHGSLCGTSCWFKALPKQTAQMKVIGNIYENPELLSV